MPRQQTFDLRFEGLRYQLIISPDGTIVLGGVGGGNGRYQLPYDPHCRWGEEDYFEIDDINALRHPFALMRAVLQTLYDWIARERPGYFYFYASTPRKKLLYERVAKRIALRMGYYFQQSECGSRFWFFRPNELLIEQVPKCVGHV